MDGPRFGDPTTYEFWDAARDKRFIIQHCRDCDAYQFYPRPFCVRCESPDSVAWVEASGLATIYTHTTVRRKVIPELDPPYVVAIVELDEGPKLITNIINGESRIGARVKLEWRDRGDMPPLPVFSPIQA